MYYTYILYIGTVLDNGFACASIPFHSGIVYILVLVTITHDSIAALNPYM